MGGMGSSKAKIIFSAVLYPDTMPGQAFYEFFGAILPAPPAHALWHARKHRELWALDRRYTLRRLLERGVWVN